MPSKRPPPAGLRSLAPLLLLTLAPTAVLAQPAEPPPVGGPTIELAPEDAPQPPIGLGAGAAPEHELVRGMTEQRFRSAEGSRTGTAIGGYGEIHVRGTTTGKEGEREWIADIPRLVLFVAHELTNSARTYIELEVEHAAGCAGCRGAVELEQAYVDWSVAGRPLGLRAGLVLVPMGIINQWHEPPIFHGVVRPKVDTVVIPSTWREIALGAFGQPIDWLRYEAYAMTGLDPIDFSAGGLAGGRQDGSFARANAWAGVARVEVEPLLGVVIGASAYVSDAGGNAEDEVFTRDGTPVEISVPVLGWSADARWRRSGLELRMVVAEWHLPESRALMLSYDDDGAPHFPDATSPVPTLIRGGYVEGAVDVLRPFDVGHELFAFARIEAYDTQAGVPDGFTANPAYSIREHTFGLTYRPFQQLAIKADYQLRNRRLGFDQTQLNFGLGFMY